MKKLLFGLLFFASPLFAGTISIYPTVPGTGVVTISTTPGGGSVGGVSVYPATGTIIPSQGIKGVVDASTATAGNVGYYLESLQVAYVNSAGSGLYTEITTLTLPPGDWDVSAGGQVNSNSTTFVSTQIELTCGELADQGNYPPRNTFPWTYVLPNTFVNFTQTVPTFRKSVKVNTTIYLWMQIGNYSVGTPRMRGYIYAREAR